MKVRTAFTDDPEYGRNLAVRVSVVTIVMNVLMSIAKLLVGVWSGSIAMISDALHSATDVFTTIIVICGIKISGKQSDECHQYGHERLECIAAVVLSLILFFTGAAIGVDAIKRLATGETGDLSGWGNAALIVAAVSVMVKEWMYWYTKAAADRIESSAMQADAWHHRSDAWSSVGAFLGVLGTMFGARWMDLAASILICLFIGKAAYSVFVDAMNKLVDRSCDQGVVLRMSSVILGQDGVWQIKRIRTRLFGNKIYVDLELIVDGNQSLREAHAIAVRVHNAVEEAFPQVKHCMVYMNPEV